MRKSNWIIVAVLVVASIIFLAMWYYFGFNYVDDPLDLVVTILWWVLTIGICVAIHVSESRRQRSIRTAFLGPDLIYNSEAGIVRLGPDEQYVPALQEIISNLDYNFDKQGSNSANDKRIRFRYIVRTDKFADHGKTWEGEVINVMKPDDPRLFKSKRELSALLGNDAA